MFSPPLRRSSPGPGLHILPAVLHPTCHKPVNSFDDAHVSTRPCLKRQATAPLPSHFTVLTKKKRETFLYSALWSDEVHAAFLEALQRHPPSSTWRLDEAFKDIPDDEQADYCRIIQEYILSKTGCPHSVEQISEQINIVLSSPLATPLVETPAEDELVFLAESEQAHARGPESNAKFNSCRAWQPERATVRASESSSMSRRRKACNRPILNLHVDLPPVSSQFGLGISPNAEESDPGAVFSGLTPYSVACRPFGNLQDGLSPSTPLEQCHKCPLVPPEIPRVIDIRRHNVGRWIPTPTEGVLPSPSYASSASSPTSIASPEGSDSSSGSSVKSSATERMQPRPKLTKKTLSWLSMPKHTSQTLDFSLNGHHEEVAHSPSVECSMVSDS
ncbi:hypothetical protein ACEPAH_4761 [Sanghuangporus vaninii]